jgi:large subunit ribosomal protein L16
MGSGKGAVDYWVAVVKPGTILFEIGSVPEEVAKAAFSLASYKLPLKTKFIIKTILLLKTINKIWVSLNLLILFHFQI